MVRHNRQNSRQLSARKRPVLPLRRNEHFSQVAGPYAISSRKLRNSVTLSDAQRKKNVNSSVKSLICNNQYDILGDNWELEYQLGGGIVGAIGHEEVSSLGNDTPKLRKVGRICLAQKPKKRVRVQGRGCCRHQHHFIKREERKKVVASDGDIPPKQQGAEAKQLVGAGEDIYAEKKHEEFPCSKFSSRDREAAAYTISVNDVDWRLGSQSTLRSGGNYLNSQETQKSSRSSNSNTSNNGATPEDNETDDNNDRQSADGRDEDEEGSQNGEDQPLNLEELQTLECPFSCTAHECAVKIQTTPAALRKHINLVHIATNHLDNLPDDHYATMVQYLEHVLGLKLCPGECALLFKKKIKGGVTSHANCIAQEDRVRKHPHIQPLPEIDALADEEPIRSIATTAYYDQAKASNVKQDQKNNQLYAISVELARQNIRRTAEALNSGGDNWENELLGFTNVFPPTSAKRVAKWNKPVVEEEEPEEPLVASMCRSTPEAQHRIAIVALQQGLQKKAQLALASKGVWSDLPIEVEDSIRKKTPFFAGVELTVEIQAALDGVYAVPSKEDIQYVITHSLNATAPGMDGQDAKFFKRIIEDEQSLVDLHTIFSAIYSAKIQTSSEVRKQLMRMRLVPLVVGDIGNRPVTIECLMMKFLAQAKFRNKALVKKIQDLSGDLQFGKGLEGEGEAIANSVEFLLEEGEDNAQDEEDESARRDTCALVDMSNAFPSLEPQFVCDFVATRIPELMSLVWLKLSGERKATASSNKRRNNVSFIFTGGVNQGGVESGGIFDAVFWHLAKPVLLTFPQLRARFQHDGIFFVGSLSDVINAKHALEIAVKAAGLKFSEAKSEVWRRKRSFTPEEEEQLRSSGYLIRKEGVIVGGVPMGSKAYVEAFLEEKMQKTCELVDGLVNATVKPIVEEPEREPDSLSFHTSYTILRQCILQRYIFYFRTIDPEITQEFAQRLEAMIVTKIFAAMRFEDHCPVGCAWRKRMQDSLLRGFTESGGGITRISDLPNVCYVAGTLASLAIVNKPHLNAHFIAKQFEGKETQEVYEAAAEGTVIYKFARALKIVKAKAPIMGAKIEALGFLIETPMPKLQHKMTTEIKARFMADFINSLPQGVAQHNQPATTKISREDLLYRNNVIARCNPFSAKFLQVHPDASRKGYMLSNSAFQQRLYLHLGGQLIPEPIKCGACGLTLDTMANHASTCMGLRGARNVRHQMLKVSLSNAIGWLNSNVLRVNEPYMQLAGYKPIVQMGKLRDSKADTKFSNAFHVEQNFMVDYNISATSRIEMTHRYRFAGAAAKVAASTKLSKYQERYNVDPDTSGTNCTLVMATIEDMGAMGNDFVKFIRQQASSAAQQSNRSVGECLTFLLQTVSVTLQKAQAMMVDECCITNGIRCGLEVDGNGNCFWNADEERRAAPLSTINIKVQNLPRYNVALNEQYYEKLTADEENAIVEEDNQREEERHKAVAELAEQTNKNKLPVRANRSRSNSGGSEFNQSHGSDDDASTSSNESSTESLEQNGKEANTGDNPPAPTPMEPIKGTPTLISRIIDPDYINSTDGSESNASDMDEDEDEEEVVMRGPRIRRTKKPTQRFSHPKTSTKLTLRTINSSSSSASTNAARYQARLLQHQPQSHNQQKKGANEQWQRGEKVSTSTPLHGNSKISDLRTSSKDGRAAEGGRAKTSGGKKRNTNKQAQNSKHKSNASSSREYIHPIRLNAIQRSSSAAEPAANAIQPLRQQAAAHEKSLLNNRNTSGRLTSIRSFQPIGNQQLQGQRQISSTGRELSQFVPNVTEINELLTNLHSQTANEAATIGQP